jgi:hypothetical protein
MTKRAHLEAHLSGEELATHYHEAPDVEGMRRQVPSGWPLLGGILALGLASLGEALIESQNPSMFTLFCYLVGISIFVLSGSYLPPVGEDTPGVPLERSSERLSNLVDQRARWLMLGSGVALSVALNLVALQLIRHDLDRPDLPQSAGPWLWLISLLMLLATGVALHRMEGWRALWVGGSVPRTERMRWILAAFLLTLFIVASVSRLVGLDHVPYGINADEGDRAATALQILHGNIGGSIFGSGWYFISKVYFSLLAGWLNLMGFGYVQARMFGGVCSILTLGVIVWIGIRHFSLRVGLLAGALGVLLGVSLQFARETTEAAQTALLWSISMALLLEAARRGRSWAWIGAGIAGGLSIYFYPTGRLWGVLAAAFCAYLFVRGQGRHRWGIFVGSVLLGIAAFMTMGPFLANALRNNELSSRAQQTSAFVNNNAVRLPYYDPRWNTAQLLDAQLDHSIGIFTEFPESGGFWPTQRPIMWGLLTVLTLVGLGWVSLDWRDSRLVGLALWFWVGFVGVITTVETPDVQRMATAVPVLPLLSALVLDNVARRVEAIAQRKSERGAPFGSRLVRRGATAAIAFVAAVLIWQQGHFYFVDYAAMDRWPQPNVLGRAVADQGPNALVATVGEQFHMVNSGWVRLLAPHADRGGIESPGASLPLAIPADHDLAFLIFPSQNYYLPYLRTLYPGGSFHPYIHPTEKLVLTIYRIPRAKVAAGQGALATLLHGKPQHVPTLGFAPPELAAYPSAIRWSAGLRVSQYGNYSIRIGPGPARLVIDGQLVLTVPAGKTAQSTTLALARGQHAISYDGTVTAPGRAALFEWKAQGSPTIQDAWNTVPTEALDSTLQSPRGLYGVSQVEGGPAVHRIDGALATCCLRDDLGAATQPFETRWVGTLRAPVSGDYSMSLFSQGTVTFQIDGRSLFNVVAAGGTLTGDTTTTTHIRLRAGIHRVQVVDRAAGTPGALEWWWKPPHGKPSIVPPTVLAPPPGAGVGPPVSPSVLGLQQPVDIPLVVIQ